MPRRQFTLQLLQVSLDRDGAELQMLADKVTSRTLVTFSCSCGNEGNRRLDYCVDFGAFCTECARKVRNNRRTATLALPPSLNCDAPFFDICMGRDDECIRYARDDELKLVLAPRYRKAYLQNTQAYIKVFWWDMQTDRQTSRWFSNKLPQSEEEAQQCLQEKLPVPDSYSCTFSVSQIVQDLRRIKCYFRIAADIIQYPAQQVPIDAYILSSWLGDGVAGRSWIVNVDHNVLAAWRKWANDHEMQFMQHKGAKDRPEELWTWAVTNFPKGALKKSVIGSLRKGVKI